jgi:hypothetical protein
MKSLPQLNKSQLELLIASLTYTSFELANSDNLARTIVEVDYAFEHYAFQNPLDKRLLVNDPPNYSSNLFNPLIDSLMVHLEALPS